mmetsp:Transcript_11706/g.36548  ORF Transcript_11706/g.36548 Transcript_11706/m.36548 type:complete len:201 (+) Transcript_11706:575-1177(+)
MIRCASLYLLMDVEAAAPSLSRRDVAVLTASRMSARSWAMRLRSSVSSATCASISAPKASFRSTSSLRLLTAFSFSPSSFSHQANSFVSSLSFCIRFWMRSLMRSFTLAMGSLCTRVRTRARTAARRCRACVLSERSASPESRMVRANSIFLRRDACASCRNSGAVVFSSVYCSISLSPMIWIASVRARISSALYFSRSW